MVPHDTPQAPSYVYVCVYSPDPEMTRQRHRFPVDAGEILWEDGTRLARHPSPDDSTDPPD